MTCFVEGNSFDFNEILFKIYFFSRIKLFAHNLTNLLDQLLESSTEAALVMPYIYVAYRNYLYLRSSQEPLYSFLKENFLSIPTVLYMKKNFFLKKTLNDKIGRLLESGLMELWTSQMIDGRYLHSLATKNIPSPLCMNHLSGIFFVWLAGSFIGLMTFSIEIIFCLVNFQST